MSVVRDFQHQKQQMTLVSEMHFHVAKLSSVAGYYFHSGWMEEKVENRSIAFI